jgi:hypothetical protein
MMTWRLESSATQMGILGLIDLYPLNLIAKGGFKNQVVVDFV